MPEREFFSLRYAIPGYTLILVIILLNIVPLFEISKSNNINSLFGAVLAFVSLFTGSAIGFLISQIWFWYFGSIGGIFSIKGSEPVKRMLISKLQPIKHEIARRDLSVILDFSISQERNVSSTRQSINENMINRIDLFHTMSSTVFSILMGLIIGIGLRLYFEVFIFNGSVFTDWNRIAGQELVLQVFVILSAAFLAILIWTKSRNYPMINYWRMLLIIDPAVDRDKIKHCFSEYFE